jgi:hypothetical protein
MVLLVSKIFLKHDYKKNNKMSTDTENIMGGETKILLFTYSLCSQFFFLFTNITKKQLDPSSSANIKIMHGKKKKKPAGPAEQRGRQQQLHHPPAGCSQKVYHCRGFRIEINILATKSNGDLQVIRFHCRAAETTIVGDSRGDCLKIPRYRCRRLRSDTCSGVWYSFLELADPSPCKD